MNSLTKVGGQMRALLQDILIVVSACLVFLARAVYAAPFETFDLAKENVAVRIADLEINPAQLGAFTKAVKEEMDEAVRIEPGVLAIYAVAIKGKPNQIRFVEIYASEEAYLTHRESPHFKKYLETTKSMITARQLHEGVPIKLSGKKR